MNKKLNNIKEAEYYTNFNSVGASLLLKIQQLETKIDLGV